MMVHASGSNGKQEVDELYVRVRRARLLLVAVIVSLVASSRRDDEQQKRCELSHCLSRVRRESAQTSDEIVSRAHNR
jgi:hypothetical protein